MASFGNGYTPGAQKLDAMNDMVLVTYIRYVLDNECLKASPS
jgi:hypothetical protein